MFKCKKCKYLFTAKESPDATCPKCGQQQELGNTHPVLAELAPKRPLHPVTLMGLAAGLFALVLLWPSLSHLLSFGQMFSLSSMLPIGAALLAIALGSYGIVLTRAVPIARFRGRSMAIWAVVLGLLTIGVWRWIAVDSQARFVDSQPARRFATKFVDELDVGNLETANGMCIKEVTGYKLNQISNEMKDWGEFRSIRWTRIEVYNNQHDVILGGIASFEIGPRQFELRLRTEFDKYKIDGWVFGR